MIRIRIESTTSDWSNIDCTYHVAITDAPVAYDGFGTVTADTLPKRLCDNLFTDVKTGERIPVVGEGEVRVVLIPDQHLKWQTERYWSGRHLGEVINAHNWEDCIISKIIDKALKLT